MSPLLSFFTHVHALTIHCSITFILIFYCQKKIIVIVVWNLYPSLVHHWLNKEFLISFSLSCIPHQKQGLKKIEHLYPWIKRFHVVNLLLKLGRTLIIYPKLKDFSTMLVHTWNHTWSIKRFTSSFWWQHSKFLEL